MKTDNLILNVDSYKTAHFGFMEPGTTKIFSYIEARKGGEYTESQFFGLQYFLLKYFSTPITQDMIDSAELFLHAHGEPFNREGWEYILKNHNGYLPIRIKAVPEGTVVPEGNVLVTVENTDPNCAWVTSYFETPLLRAAWYGTTVATRSLQFKKLISRFLNETGDTNGISFKMNDFGSRGATSKESSEIAGAAHLINSLGTDNIVGILATQDYYGATDMTGFSVPASEHSVTTAYGEERERDFISHAIDVFGKPGGLISLVADSYDMDNFVRILGEELKDKIINSGATIVVRPDSGIPEIVVHQVIENLNSYFGHTINDKGYKVLHPSVRVIQGDGINLESVERILTKLKVSGWSADNVVFGCGGYLLQQLNRDTLRFAMKASYVEVNGESRDVFKNPRTDPSKASKRGRLTLVSHNNEIKTIREEEFGDDMVELLETVFENGNILRQYTFDEVRRNAS